MNAKDVIRSALNMNDMVMAAYLGDLDESDFMRRPGPGCNHVAWQLGHLITAEANVLNGIRPGSAPPLPEGFAEKHSNKTTTSDNPADFYPRAVYMDLAQQLQQATRTLLDSLSDSDLDAPSPESLRSWLPRVGDCFVLIATHPLMHAGQLVPIRRATGKPVKI